MTCIELGVRGQKLSTTLKGKDLAILAFKYNSRHTHQTSWSRDQFQKGQPTSCKTTHAFPRSPLG